MRIIDDQSIGVIIDIQEKLLPHVTDAPRIEEQAVRLIQGLNLLGIPLLYTEQYPKGLGPTVPSVAAELENGHCIVKGTFSCCDEDPFSSALTETGRKTVLLAGVEAHVCVLQTTIDLVERGYTPVVIADATSSRSAFDRDTAFARMRQEGVIISTVESILFELTRTSGNPRFREISKLVK